MSSFLQKLNDGFRDSFAGKFFEIEKHQTTFCNELRGALATFMSMAYILAVNPRILADSGGPCTGDIFSDEYASCQETIKREYVTSTASTFLP
jgi:AGZA family xanthine/uracil permease-like MFS transporter